MSLVTLVSASGLVGDEGVIRSYKDEVTVIQIRRDGVKTYTECEVWKNGEWEKQWAKLLWERRKAREARLAAEKDAK